MAAMESYLFHYEDAQDDPVEGLSGVWLPESDTGPDAVGGVATELFRIPYEDIVIDKERGLVLLKRWSPELFETTGLNLDDMRDEGI